MTRALLVLSLASLTLFGCNAEKFVSPPQPDLYKVPYDFGFDLLGTVGNDLGVPDMSEDEHDFSVAHDLATDNPD